MDTAIAAKEKAVSTKEKADAEREAAVAVAQEVSEAAPVAMTGERDETVTEEEPALGERESEGKADESLGVQVDTGQTTVQKKIKELRKANDNLTNDNVALKVFLPMHEPLHIVVELMP